MPQADLGSFDTVLFFYSIPGIFEAFFIETVFASILIYSIKTLYSFSKLTTKFAFLSNKTVLKFYSNLTSFQLPTPLEQFEIVEMSWLSMFGNFYIELLVDDSQVESLLNCVLFIFFCSAFLSQNTYLLQNKINLIIKNTFYFFLKGVYYQNKKVFSGWAYSTFAIFLLLLILNVQGIIPGGTTVTANLLPVFVGGLGSFLFFNFQGVLLHKLHIFNIFFPSGSPFNLAALIIPIEFVSYVFRVISISVRLFANMMAGHTLLKVIAGFAFEMFSFSGLEIYLVSGIVLVLVLLSFLEFSVALIQTYVYITLCGMYYIDSLYLH